VSLDIAAAVTSCLPESPSEQSRADLSSISSDLAKYPPNFPSKPDVWSSLHLSSIPDIHAIPIRIATCPFFLVRSSSLRFSFLLAASIGGLNRIREDIRGELRGIEEELVLGFPLTVFCFHSSALCGGSSRLEKYSVIILGRRECGRSRRKYPGTLGKIAENWHSSYLSLGIRRRTRIPACKSLLISPCPCQSQGR